MTEEIIVNGVNVAECEFYFQDEKYSCDLSFINQEELCKCDDIQDCTYKQLKRLEQERDELKKTVENQKLEYEELQCDLSEVENACGCYQSENAKLKQENKANEKQIELDVEHICRLNEQIKKLEQENKELSFAIEKCLENAGIECDDEEQALRSLPMLGNAHYKVLVEKEALEQENKELKEKFTSFMNGDYCADGCKKMNNAFCDAHTAIINENNKLRSALEEIRELVKADCKGCTAECDCDEDCTRYRIKNKINEVLSNDRN